jgi:hypothetical protein
MFRGPCHGGLYPLVPSAMESSKHAFITIKPSSSTWHHCLGHPSSFIVQQVLRKNNLPYTPEINSYVCDPCQQAKSHQLPYPISTSVSTVPLEQVFSDVWGPAPASVGQHSYYVSFIDDFSKFTWIYLLNKRSDVYQVFLNFQQLVERKFGRKIISMQTDWGGEYEKLHGLFPKVGITHHVSCPHAHQQNGSAERKHRHIVDVGLSLLANASMPLKYWDEAFLTTTFLINLLPSKVLNFMTPVEKLLNVKPNYDSLRVFGCACWPNLRPYNTQKLVFRSKRCVFLGYSSMHKGDKCLDVSTGRRYISRDVVFDKNIFPFHSLHPNAGSRFREEILLLPSNNQEGVSNNDDHMPVVPITNFPQVDVDDSTADEQSDDANSSENFNQSGPSDEETSENRHGTEPHPNTGTPKLEEDSPSDQESRDRLQSTRVSQQQGDITSSGKSPDSSSKTRPCDATVRSRARAHSRSRIGSGAVHADDDHAPGSANAHARDAPHAVHAHGEEILSSNDSDGTSGDSSDGSSANEHPMSRAGKETFLKAVIQAIPTHVMSCFQVPVSTCDKMKSSIAKLTRTM